jgi:hypothetical protein
MFFCDAANRDSHFMLKRAWPMSVGPYVASQKILPVPPLVIQPIFAIANAGDRFRIHPASARRLLSACVYPGSAILRCRDLQISFVPLKLSGELESAVLVRTGQPLSYPLLCDLVGDATRRV